MTKSSRSSDVGLLLGGLGVGVVAGYAVGRLATEAGSAEERDRPDHRLVRSGRGFFGRPRKARAVRTVTIDRPRADLYRYWRDFTNLPQFMENLHDVTVEGDVISWAIRAPGQRDVRVQTRIVEDKPGEAIAWRSTEESEVETEGSVRFRDAPAGRGTEVEAVVDYRPPFGEAGRLVAKLYQAEPQIQGRRELKRFKMLMETGEIATSRNRKPRD